jgi:CheY-like chemotaxis protein
LTGDANRLNQILTNLLANAIKYTDRGRVNLSVRQIAADARSVTLLFVVSDTGIGIAPDVQARLFTPFMQADASITRRFGGTGLGLSIVKHMVTLLGGKVDMCSTHGVGSEFSVTLQFALATQDALDQPAILPAASLSPALSGVRVLVVDDSDITLDVAKRILELQGARVALAANGEEALDRLRAEPTGFDVVLMDVQMPVLDGHAATRRIRAELGLKLPIIALTAGALSSERPRALAAGMNDFIIKPFDPQRLVESVFSHVRGEYSEPAGASPEAVITGTRGAGSWPEIDGIDAAAARMRFGNDVGLFRSLLGRLLTEFSDMAFFDTGAISKDCAFAGRAHKLKGCAGALGALSIHRLAGLIEEACGVGNVPEIQQLTTQLTLCMRRLRDAAASTPASASDPEPGCDATAAVIGPDEIVNLASMLRLQTQSSVDLFHSLAPRLRRRLGTSPYEALREQVDTLQFAAAAAALEGC